MRDFLAFFREALPAFTSLIKVDAMKTAHTLILLRQYACQRLVSPRLRG
jgi:hypothetical protein